MSPQKQFEGTDVQVLLNDIRREYGYDPTITRAETYRAGGVLGFFAREKYRLIVDESPVGAQVPGADDAANRLPRGALPSGDPFALLAEEIDDMVMGDEAISARLAPESEPKSVEIETPVVESQPQPPAQEASLEAPSFESVLSKVANLVDAPSSQAAPQAAPAELEESRSDPDPITAATDALTEPGEVTEPLTAEVAAVEADTPAPGGVAHQAVPAIDTPPMAALPWPSLSISPGNNWSGNHAQLVRALRRTGLDRDFVSGVMADLGRGRDLTRALVDAFSTLPAPPQLPRAQGSLIVVVGQAQRAKAEAKELAAEVGADPGAIFFATPNSPARGSSDSRKIHSADEATDLVPSARRRKIDLVAVEVPIGSPNLVWAEYVIEALHPTLVLGIVDATSKIEDVAAWVDGLGGVDGLVIDSPSATVSPADLLRLSIPVCRLGAGPANPARWTATILDRVPPWQ